MENGSQWAPNWVLKIGMIERMIFVGVRIHAGSMINASIGLGQRGIQVNATGIGPAMAAASLLLDRRL